MEVGYPEVIFECRSAVRAPGPLCAEAGTRAAAPFPAPLSPPAAPFLRYAPDRFLLTKPNTLPHNRVASVATLRWCSGSSRNAVRLPFGMSVQLRRNTQLKDGLPFRPWARELQAARNAENSKDSPDAKCLPMGPFMDHSNRSPRKILQVAGLLVILYEKSFAYRQIFTDGRPLPTDPQPSFYGYSTGKWDGDKLVVQTIGLRDNGWADEEGSP